MSIVNNTWPHPPPQRGRVPSGRMAHSSVYVSEVGLVYVYGGEMAVPNNRIMESSSLLVYNPLTYYWNQVKASSVRQAFHTTVLMGGALVSFGGYSEASCFSSEVSVYDIRKLYSLE